MASQNSYALIGKKEDVSSIISNITPTKVPFTTMTGKETVHNWLFTWEEDELRAAADNAKVEGITYAPVDRTEPSVKTNVTQIFNDTFGVTGTAESVSTHGRGSLMAYHANLAAKALRLDYERACVGNAQTIVNPANNSTARKFAGVQAQIDESMYVYTGGTGTAPTEANLLDALELAYNEGADPSIIMVTPAISRVVAAFAAASGRQRDFASSKKIVNVVDLYVSPFGEQKVVLNRNLKSSDTLILDPSMWVKVALKGRDWFTEVLAKVGDRTEKAMTGEFSLKNKASMGSAMVTKAVDPN